MFKNKFKVIIILFLIITVLTGIYLFFLKGNLYTNKFNKDNFAINLLTNQEGPFVFDDIANLEKPEFAVDKDGIILYNDKSYSPNQIANIGLYYLDSYRKTHKSEYLIMSKKYSDKLMSLSINNNGARYFAYNFNFSMHGQKEETLVAPWYSGMAQGEALSLFSKLYQETHQKEYLDIANDIFKSFSVFKKNSSPWTVLIDEKGYYWIEEYPEQDPDHTLNGFIFSLYGVYDYYELTKSIQARDVIQGSLTTIKHYLADFQSPGNISFYCLKHKVQNESYHKTHIKQLNMLYKITGDNYFKTMADNFTLDHSPNSKIDSDIVF